MSTEINQATYTAQNVERKESGVIAETKENLTELRNHELSKLPEVKTLYTELEKTYGKYLFVPYDIPKIQPYDLQKFVVFFFQNGKHAGKQVEDLSSATFNATKSTYLSIDSNVNSWTPVWTRNIVESIYTEFPEIFEQIHDLMPWIGEKNFRWNMWSSANRVPPHRDHTSMIDMPLAMRIKLFDSNISETLSLLTDPIKQHSNGYVPLPKLEDTNSYAWNNLRTKHASTWRPTARKILFIWRDKLSTPQQINQYVDLLDRSIAKYQDTDKLWIDSNPATDYINLD
jgi:hypothetical protein